MQNNQNCDDEISIVKGYSLLCVHIFTGFENFFPKGKGPKPKSTTGTSSKKNGAGSNSSSSKSSKKENPFEKFGKSGGSSGGGRKKPNKNDDQSQALSAAALLLLVLAGRSMFEDENGNGGSNGREITFNDFYNHILEPGDVDRIVVVNNKTARVFLKPGSPGVPLHSSRSGSAVTSRADVVRSSAKKISSRQNGGGDPYEDNTVMDMGESSANSTYASESSSPFSSSMLTESSRQQTRQLVYHFHIGSVESFEEKLSRSQQELGISPRDYVPVQYANETNWGVELVKSAPALLMIGLMAYMMRGVGGMGGGAGGGGGMGGIFKVGKSNAKKIGKEDVNVTFKDVAGCQVRFIFYCLDECTNCK